MTSAVEPLLVASHNKSKLAEIQKVVGPYFNLQSLEDIGFNEEIEESGSTFHENARIKSETLHRRYGGNVLSDDSGLEVHALHGAPGIYSARFAGVPPNDTQNIAKLLALLNDHTNRSARFITVLSLYWRGQHLFFDGVVNGLISPTPRGQNGFGYDPIFIPDGGLKTFAEMTSAEKNAISHRSLALKAMQHHLQKKTP